LINGDGKSLSGSAVRSGAILRPGLPAASNLTSPRKSNFAALVVYELKVLKGREVNAAAVAQPMEKPSHFFALARMITGPDSPEWLRCATDCP
jgi:hypothetical protein